MSQRWFEGRKLLSSSRACSICSFYTNAFAFMGNAWQTMDSYCEPRGEQKELFYSLFFIYTGIHYELASTLCARWLYMLVIYAFDKFIK